MASRDLNKLKEPFQTSVRELLDKIKHLDPLVTETTRTLAEQKEYVRKGVSWTLNSKHLTGEAVDIAFLSDSKLSYDAKKYDELYSILKDIPWLIWPYKDLEWGVDKPHVQYDPTKPPKRVIIPNMDLQEAKETIRDLNTEIGRVTKERDICREALSVSRKKESKNYKNWQTCLDSRQPWAIQWLKDKLGL